MKVRLYRLLLWAAVLGLMAVIFAFSAQHGAGSEEMTIAAAMPVAELLASMKEGADAETVMLMYVIFGTFLRKLAHLCEYALLGLLLRLLCMSYGLQAPWLPFAVGTAYAAADEIHQLFVPGRTGMLVDVVIDAIGVLLGIYSLSLIRKFRRKKHVHDP